MKDAEEKLSSYIDSLNEDRKPCEHVGEIKEAETKELFEAVRLVRSLREPNMPEEEYIQSLSQNINKQLIKRRYFKKRRKNWILGMASVAAVISFLITWNGVWNFKSNAMVYAMEQAFKEVKAYNGILEFIETNGDGKSITQSKIEVWADKEGRYYVRGLEGSQKDLITANDGEKKWQVKTKEKEINIFRAFPDPYSFTFNIRKEIKDVKNAVKTKTIGEEAVAGRNSTIIEVTPQGGSPYKLWIDKETKLPLQKQSSMEYGLKYTIRYENINFIEDIPKKLLTYSLPSGFKEINNNPKQVVNNLVEAKDIVGFIPKELENIPGYFVLENIEITNNNSFVITNYVSQDSKKKVSIFQKKASEDFKPASMSILGTVDGAVAEIQSPLQEDIGFYTSASNIISVRWQEESFEYAVVGNTSLEELTLFIQELADGKVDLSIKGEQNFANPKVKVPVDLKIEEEEQKNVDAGHSPWKLDPIFVTQVFVSLKISPEGIKGDYPIKYEELKLVKNNGIEAEIEVGENVAHIRKVYLKKLIREDSTGIWTVVGYDEA